MRDLLKAVDLVKIVDFGIAALATASIDGQKLTSTGSIFGSPLYMSPEQSLGQAVSETSDIYSCGCAIFETLTGRPPYRGENAFATMLMHQHSAVPRLNAGAEGRTFKPGLQPLIDRMMAKDRGDRFQSFAEVAAWLNDLSQGRNPDNGIGQEVSSNKEGKAAQTIDEPSAADATGARSVPVLLTSTAFLLAASASMFLWSKYSSTHKIVAPASEQKAISGAVPDKAGQTPAKIAAITDRHLKTTTDGATLRPYRQRGSAKDSLVPRTFVFPSDKSLGDLTWNPWPNSRHQIYPSGKPHAQGELSSAWTKLS